MCVIYINQIIVFILYFGVLSYYVLKYTRNINSTTFLQMSGFGSRSMIGSTDVIKQRKISSHSMAGSISSARTGSSAALSSGPLVLMAINDSDEAEAAVECKKTLYSDFF